MRPMRRGRADPPEIFFASCAPGLEAELHAEGARLRLGRLESQVGGIRFTGATEDGWRAVLHLRTALRVYRRLARFGAPSAEELYRGAQEVDWDRVMRPDQTLAVDAKVTESSHSHSGFVALKLKDAVADWFRDRHGVRPSVNTENPDVRLSAHLFQDRCTLSVDLAGRSLHRRGYRVAQTPAPLGECLAAGAVGLSGWDLRSPFLDPMCGSGTLLIEAGLRAANVAPGLFSDDYAFLRHLDFRRDRWDTFREEARRAIRMSSKLILRGGDIDPDAVSAARRNAEAAGLGDVVRVVVADVRDFSPTPGWGATVVSNPPYGVRLEDEESLLPLYETLGRVFKERCKGFHIHLFLASGRLARAFRLKPAHYWPLMNGGLACRLARYEIR